MKENKEESNLDDFFRKEWRESIMLEKLRDEVWRSNLELPKHSLAKLTSGNVSGRDSETNLVVIKPSGYSYEELTPADMVVVDLEGNVVEGHLLPSTDTETHLYVYKQRPEIFGICHTHSPYASVFAALGKPIPACLTTTAMIGGEIPIGGYVVVGGKEIGQELVSKIGRSLAILMQNHGVFTIGSSAKEATKIAIEVEDVAKITMFSLLLGNPITLNEDQIAEFANIYQNHYGQKR
jgi:L-ribulose-5-phosphate 4-epimerase